MKILVIDDKQENRESAEKAFSAEHEVVTVDSYDSAMDLIHQRVSGREVYRALGRPFYGGIVCDDEFREKEKELTPKFDFALVLIDLMMPASDQALGSGCEHRRGESMPYGFPLMFHVAREHGERVKAMAVVSDVSHHHHAMSASLDWLVEYSCQKTSMKINDVPCKFIHARFNVDGSKDWTEAFEALIPSDTDIDD